MKILWIDWIEHAICVYWAFQLPMVQNENLKDVFLKIAGVLQFNLDGSAPIPSLVRLSKKTNPSNGANQINIDNSISGPTIIAQFIAPHTKREFFSAYLKKVSLSTVHLGFQLPSKRIINSENLTKVNKSLFDAALLLRKQRRLHQVFTTNGLVYVRTSPGARPHCIRTTRDLYSVIADPGNQGDAS